MILYEYVAEEMYPSSKSKPKPVIIIWASDWWAARNHALNRGLIPPLDILPTGAKTNEG